MPRTYTAEDVCDAIVAIMDKVSTILPPGLHQLGVSDPIKEKLMAETQIKSYVVEAYGFGKVGYRHEVNHCFGCGVEVNIEFVWRGRGRGLEAVVSVSWASGPGDLNLALASAELHLETCKKAALVKGIMENDQLHRMVADGTGELWDAGLTLYRERTASAADAFWKLYHAEKGE